MGAQPVNKSKKPKIRTVKIFMARSGPRQSSATPGLTGELQTTAPPGVGWSVLLGAFKEVDAGWIMQLGLKKWMADGEPHYGRVEWRIEVTRVLAKDGGVRDEENDVRTISRLRPNSEFVIPFVLVTEYWLKAGRHSCIAKTEMLEPGRIWNKGAKRRALQRKLELGKRSKHRRKLEGEWQSRVAEYLAHLLGVTHSFGA